MKKSLLILGGIGLLCLLLVIRLFYIQHTGFNEERQWFVKALRYEFSARVDSIRMLNEHTGRLWCRIISGDPQTHREDSLKASFTEHDMLYLIFYRSADSIIFLVPDARLIAKGDSVRVSSEKDSIHFYRNGKPVVNGLLTETLTGFGRPFFLR